nr:hypothetical protein [Achromobacter sp.]
MGRSSVVVNDKDGHCLVSRHQRGHGTAWDRLRVLVLKRHRKLCQCSDCLSTGCVLPATEVDHRIPKSEGGGDVQWETARMGDDAVAAELERDWERDLGAGRR